MVISRAATVLALALTIVISAASVAAACGGSEWLTIMLGDSDGTVLVDGGGFDEGAAIALRGHSAEGALLGQVTADENGRFSAEVPAPEAVSGLYRVVADRGEGSVAHVPAWDQLRVAPDPATGAQESRATPAGSEGERAAAVNWIALAGLMTLIVTMTLGRVFRRRRRQAMGDPVEAELQELLVEERLRQRTLR